MTVQIMKEIILNIVGEYHRPIKHILIEERDHLIGREREKESNQTRASELNLIKTNWNTSVQSKKMKKKLLYVA